MDLQREEEGNLAREGKKKEDQVAEKSWKKNRKQRTNMNGVGPWVDAFGRWQGSIVRKSISGKEQMGGE